MTPGSNGYNHRARIARTGDVDGTYMIVVPTVAPDRLWGPIPSITPDLAVGDVVLVSQVGMTRDDLVIIGKLPGTLPDYTDIPGLDAALDAKANQTDLTALTTRVSTDEAAITANGSAITALQARATADETAIANNSTAITANGAAITTLQGRATADETAITNNSTAISALQAARPLGASNDVDINGDLLRTVPRANAGSSITVTNGHGYYFRMRCEKAATIAVIKFCIAAAGAGGTLSLAAWSGPTLTALTYRAAFTASLAVNRQDWTLGASAIPLAAGDHLVVGLLGVGNTTAPTLSASPVVNSTLINQDANQLTSVSTTASTLTTLGTAALNLGTLTGYNLLTQIPWLAATP